MTEPIAPATPGAVDPSSVRVIRHLLLATLALGMTGMLAELLLLGHTEGFWQLVPVVLLGIGLLTILGRWFRPGRNSFRMLQGVMVLLLVSGLVGVIQHYRGNAEFELEMTPSVGGFELFWESVTGATPALAPGAMAGIGLIGIAYAYRHPLSAGSS